MKVKFPIVLLLITTRPIGVTCLKAMNKTQDIFCNFNTKEYEQKIL